MSEPAIQPQGHLGIRPDKETFLAEENPFEAMMERFDHAAQLLNLDPGLYKVLRNPEKQIIVSVSIIRDYGEVEVYTGYRVLYNTSRGPAKGGIRFDLNVTLAEVKALAAWVTGKPVEMADSLGRREATGRGCMIVTREALARLGMSLKGARVAVQGFGNVGSVSADLMAREGATIVAVSDKSGGVYDPKGLDVADLLRWVGERRHLSAYSKAEHITNEQLLVADCDVLIPAATENVITRKNAPNITAKVICEGANGPTTAAADKVLEEKGIFVIPDILANAGGVTVSYFEWVQDRGGYFWDLETVNRRLESIMERSFHEVLGLVDKHKVSTRIACYMLAVDRVAAMHRLRGMYA